MTCYLDYNATTIMPDRVLQVLIKWATRGNASSIYPSAKAAKKMMECFKKEIAEITGLKLEGDDGYDIVFTSGGSESNTWIITSAVRSYMSLTNKRPHVITSNVEHDNIMMMMKNLEQEDVDVTYVPVRKTGPDLGSVDPEDVYRAIRPNTCIIAIMAANNETGCLQPWESVRTWCQEQEIAFFCDASQWVGRLPVNGLGACDWVSACAHKFGGPKGVGFLKCPSKGRLDAFILGGPQEMNRRAGTENVPGILSMVASLEAREKEINEESIKQRLTIQQEFEALLQSVFPNIRILGKDVNRLWNTTSVIMPEVDCRIRWVVKLDKEGFAVSTGSACSSGKEKTSHVLASMGLNASEAGRVLRFSSGWDTSLNAWDALSVALQDVFQKIIHSERALE